MYYSSEQPKYYRFPSRTSILDYETEYSIYFPSRESGSVKEQTYQKERNQHKNTYSVEQNFY